MSVSPNTRLVPQVFYILPPKKITIALLFRPIRKRLLVHVFVLAAVCAGVSIERAITGDLEPFSARWGSAQDYLFSESLLLVAILGGLLYFGVHLAIVLMAGTMVRKTPFAFPPETEYDRRATEQVSAALLDHWGYALRNPSWKVVREAIRGCSAFDPTRPWIVCGSRTRMPPPDDRVFEPEIIPPTSLSWRFLRGLLGAIGIFALFTILGPRAGFSRGQMRVFIVILAGAVVLDAMISLRRFWLRPTYIRVAPGLIQVLRYPVWGEGKPVIHSYPMEAGTVVIATSARVDLVRGILHDVVLIRPTRRPKETRELLFRALMSTAPIPKLSDSELLG